MTRARSEFMRRQDQPALADSVRLEITLAAEAEPGRRELRVKTPRGISNPLAFYVGRLPELFEQESKPSFEPQDFLEVRLRQPLQTEAPITLPAVVSGQTQVRERCLRHRGRRKSPCRRQAVPLKSKDARRSTR